MSVRRRGRTIGAVLEQLLPDFPDLTISKIRFLEGEGLLTPERTPSGYRLYADADVERLRYILTAQRDRFWPLKVIRDALDAMERGLTPAEPGHWPDSRPVVPAPEPDPDVPSAREIAGGEDLRLTETELQGAAGLSTELLASLRSFGLLRPDAGGHFDEHALAVARAAAALASYGVEARHLRPFRTAAEREVGLMAQIVAPLAAREKDTREQLKAEVLHHCLALHAALAKAELHRN